VCNALFRVVDDDGELIGEEAVAAFQHEISAIGIDIDRNRTLDLIDETHYSWFDSKSHGAGGIRLSRAAATPSGIARLFANRDGCDFLARA